MVFHETDLHFAHGTCMLSRASGNYYGVAKNPSPILVPLPNPPASHAAVNVLRALALILKDHKEVNGDMPAVISMSYGLDRYSIETGEVQIVDPFGADRFEDLAQVMASVLNFLSTQGLALLTAAGNDGKVGPILFPSTLNLTCLPDYPTRFYTSAKCV